MIKVILFDADGVVIKPHKYFSERFAKEFAVDPEKIAHFFKEIFPRCLLGQTDLKQEIAKLLPEWRWNGTAEELLEYWFSGERETDEDVLQYIDDARSQGVKCYLVSDQEQYRAEYILNTMRLAERFDGAFFSYSVGFRKSDKEFFEYVLDRIGDIRPMEILYVDDDEKNIMVAESVGICARLYTSFRDFKNKDGDTTLKKS
ncbi:MAG: HAD family hydrolase [Candidatus Sungbacteria bacterium]|nr:HAD family hydrolase [Candidatus Sungbacteria bacterium]